MHRLAFCLLATSLALTSLARADTADERFVVERIDGIVVGAGTSGHAFKFGPLLGGQLADLVLAGG